jgi:hypothetical protein
MDLALWFALITMGLTTVGVIVFVIVTAWICLSTGDWED